MGLLWRRAIGSVVVALGLVTAARASAEEDNRVRCSDSYERAQLLRRSEDFKGAQAALAICRATCPADLVRDCERWSSELGVLRPTLRFVVKDDHGAALDDVTILAEGQRLTPDAAGLVTVTPGRHVFRLERRGSSPVDVDVDVHAGEQSHVVAITMVTAGPEAPALRAEPERRSVAPAIAIGGAGVAGLVLAGILTVKGHVDRSDLRSTCYPACNPDDVDAVRTLFWAAAGVGVASAALLAAAVVLYPRAPRTGETPRLAVGTGPATMSLRLVFD